MSQVEAQEMMVVSPYICQREIIVCTSQDCNVNAVTK